MVLEVLLVLDEVDVLDEEVLDVLDAAVSEVLPGALRDEHPVKVEPSAAAVIIPPKYLKAVRRLIMVLSVLIVFILVSFLLYSQREFFLTKGILKGWAKNSLRNKFISSK